MREHLISYVDLLFAGAPHAADIKQEILQNTLDRFDDLIGQGKSPEAAYQLAISGIGDINEILCTGQTPEPVLSTDVVQQKPEKPVWKKVLQVIGICLYILCPVPLFVLQNELGLCVLLGIVAIATALVIFSGEKEEEKKDDTPATPESELRKGVQSIINTVGICVYLGVSFLTQAWYITWLIFPIMAAVNGLVRACLDLKEEKKHEA